jgi:formyl-CoA transferase
VFRSASRAHWLALLQQHDVPSAPINNVAEALDDPQVKHLGLEQPFGQGDRAASLLAYPVEFGGTPIEPNLPPPHLGEHTGAILSELGYSEDDIQRLHAEGAI